MEEEDLNGPGETESWVQACGPETIFQAEALAEGFLLSQSLDQHHAGQVRLLRPGLLNLYGFSTNRPLEADSDHGSDWMQLLPVLEACLSQPFKVQSFKLSVSGLELATFCLQI